MTAAHTLHESAYGMTLAKDVHKSTLTHIFSLLSFNQTYFLHVHTPQRRFSIYPLNPTQVGMHLCLKPIGPLAATSWRCRDFTILILQNHQLPAKQSLKNEVTVFKSAWDIQWSCSHTWKKWSMLFDGYVTIKCTQQNVLQLWGPILLPFVSVTDKSLQRYEQRPYQDFPKALGFIKAEQRLSY